MKKNYTCPINLNTLVICLNTLVCRSPCENCTTVDACDEKCRLCNQCKLHTGYTEQIKHFNSCVEDICYSHPRGYLCSNCHYNKCDQWENTYPGMIGKKP